MYRLSIFLSLIALIGTSVLPATAATQTKPDQYVRTANYFLLSGPALDDPNTVRTLSGFDLLVLPAEAQVYNQSFFQKARSLNPDIVILAYVPTVSWNHLYWVDPLHQKLQMGIRSTFWLKDGNGNIKSVWPNTSALNLTTGWADYLAQFTATEILGSGLWDGVFYDEVQDSISWVGTIDTNADGVNDSAREADARWADAYVHLLESTRTLIGTQAVLITNGSSNSRFAPHVNGRMYENFPSSDRDLTTWGNHARDYLSQMDRVTRSDVTIVNVTSRNSGINTDYRQVRYGITTTLLGNGYFGFDFGDQNHGQLWTYDEYRAYLGSPKGQPKNGLNGSAQISPGVWEREFSQGKVLVNATDERRTVALNGEFEKLRGTQDPRVNDGSIVSRLTLESKDGIILLRPIEALNNTAFPNGAFARVFDAEGRTKRNGFFAYESSQRGGEQIVRFDVNRDGTLETVAAGKTYVTIWNTDGTLRAKFAPYTERYTLGINVTVGDLENDGVVEIVTGTQKGGGPQLRIFNQHGNLIHPGFFAYDKNFRGGVQVAIGDLNGDAVGEIITGAGVGGGAHVRVFDRDGNIKRQFFAITPEKNDGIFVAAADLDGDRKDEIIGLSSQVFTISLE